ncbi:MAG: coenzyme pyrophosphatase [Frankiales bacterium]|nr:coenzyme pyrophosphatase [Frankiales bacterium]
MSPSAQWLQPLATAAASASARQLSRFTPPADGSGRHSAVLMLFSSPSGELADGQLLLLLRAAKLRAHAGQVAFPGGAADPGDADATETALREASEEVGLRPESVDVLTELAPVYLPISSFVVTPVLASWREPHEVGVMDPGEVAGVFSAPVPELLDPANRFTVSHSSGLLSPGFESQGMFIWGFTAGLIDRLLALAGWARPWNVDIVRAAPEPVVEPFDEPI